MRVIRGFLVSVECLFQSPSTFLFVIKLRWGILGVFKRRSGDNIAFRQPPAKVDIGAAFGAKWPIFQILRTAANGTSRGFDSITRLFLRPAHAPSSSVFDNQPK